MVVESRLTVVGEVTVAIPVLDTVCVTVESRVIVVGEVIVWVEYPVLVIAEPPNLPVVAGIITPRLAPIKIATITINTVKVLDSALRFKVDFVE